MDGYESEAIKLRDAPGRRKRDFMALFNALWYRDFPYIYNFLPPARGDAMYTAHINSVVKGCADLMGFFAWFETGLRTDIVINQANGHTWAKVEIERNQPHRKQINEIAKLSEAARNDEADVCIFIGYSSTKELDINLKYIEKEWRHENDCLMFLLIIFEVTNDRRNPKTLQTYLMKAGRAEKVREQPALPWKVPGTRWEMQTKGTPTK